MIPKKLLNSTNMMASVALVETREIIKKTKTLVFKYSKVNIGYITNVDDRF